MKCNASIMGVRQFKELKEDQTMSYGRIVIQERVEKLMDFNFLIFILDVILLFFILLARDKKNFIFYKLNDL
jgi:hypothetical protein